MLHSGPRVVGGLEQAEAGLEGATVKGLQILTHWAQLEMKDFEGAGRAVLAHRGLSGERGSVSTLTLCRLCPVAKPFP